MNKKHDSWVVDVDGGAWELRSICEEEARTKYGEYCRQSKGEVTLKKNGELIEMRNKLDAKRGTRKAS